jgi:hypothetical protein
MARFRALACCHEAKQLLTRSTFACYSGASAVRQWFTTTAKRPAKFGRYTGRTLYPGVRKGGRDQKRLKTLEYYLRIEDDARARSASGQALVNILKQKGRWPAKPDSVVGAFDGLRRWYGNPGQHWQDANGEPLRAIERLEDTELLTRHEIQTSCPDLLITFIVARRRATLTDFGARSRRMRLSVHTGARWQRTGPLAALARIDDQ